jgi:hypothetical protein
MRTCHEKYIQWIDAYVTSGKPIRGECRQVCAEMLVHFPELRLKGGYVRTPIGSDLHYWLLAPDGSIVDPTEAQFGYLDPEDYEDAGTTDPLVLLQRYLFTEPERVQL